MSFPSKTAATAEAKRLLRDLQLEGAVRGHGPKLTGITFSELARRWLVEQADRVATGAKRPSSLITNGFWLKAVLATFATLDGAKIGTHEIVAYQKARLASGRAPATINSEVALMRRVLRWACDKNLLGKVPKVEQLPLPRKRVALPTLAEMELILNALPERTALLVRFLAETGCRKGEAFALEWSDLDYTEGVVMIQRKANFTPETERSDRDIPVSASLMADLKAAQDIARRMAKEAKQPVNPLVFPGRGGKRMTEFDKALASRVKKAKVVRNGEPLKLTPHMLRKAHATWLGRGLLQSRLGHVPGSKITRSTYIHLTTEDHRRAVIDLAKAPVKTG